MSQQFSSQSTDSFNELLTKAKCSLLVSTYQAGQLVIVRAQDKGVNTHFMAVSRPMGIATRANEFSLGGKSTIGVFRNLPAVGTKTGQGEGVDACYLNRRTYQTGAIDIHEMGYDKNNILWFVNTKMSCLCTLHEDYSFVPQWRPPFISAYDLTDRCHLNGLGFRDGLPRYVSMLGAYDTAGGWRQNKISGGQIMDVSNNEVLVDGLCMPHSPRWYRGKLYFLSSGAGQFMSMELGKAAKVVAELPGFARGLDFIDHYALIGLSQIRESSTFAGLPLTKKVEERQSGVWVVDLDTGNTVAFLKFTGNVQEVFDIKVMPYCYPTVIEESNPLVVNSYELPDKVLNNLAVVDPVESELTIAVQLHKKGKFKKAIEAYKTILEKNHEHRQVNHHLGMCLFDDGQWTQAIEQLTKVVEEQSDNVEAMNTLGLAWLEKGDTKQGMHWLDQSIATDNQFAKAHFNRGLQLLKQGKYKQGWPEYEWRWQTPSFVRFQCQQPQWQGEDIRDKRLLIHSEQGNGDQIQFLRFLPMVAKLCKELIYVGPEVMAPLVGEIGGVSESRTQGMIQKDRFDVWSPLMNLPRWLGITLENLPSPERYLKIPKSVTVSQLKADFKVGICWQGSVTFKGNKKRSLQLTELSALFDIEGVTFYSLQMPISKQDKELLDKHNIIDLEPELPGYARTAALVDQLDLVITVDTAITHVAGALGKTTWTLLSANPDWRWLESGIESHWYPNHKLYRRKVKEENWNAVVSKIKSDLISLQKSVIVE